MFPTFARVAESMVGSVTDHLAAYADLVEIASNRALNWSLLAVAPLADITAPVRALRNQLLLVSLVVALIIMVGSFVMVRGLMAPVGRTTEVLKGISEGEGDLTRRMDAKYDDETGRLALYFNKTSDKIRDFVVGIRDEARRLCDRRRALLWDVAAKLQTGEPVTAKEFDLLALFARNPGRAYSRPELLAQVWGYQYEGYEHTVNSHINRLRGKIERDPGRPRFLRTVWGVGYRFAEPAELQS